MTTYFVPSETLTRLSTVCSFFDASLREDTKSLINTIRLENLNGSAYAVVTNGQIAAIEYLGKTDNPDGVCHLKLSQSLLEMLKHPRIQTELLTITTIPEIAVSTLTCNELLSYPDICYWFDETPLDGWRKWVNLDCPTASKGAMYWDTFQIEALIKASPSGGVVFPEFIDSTKPVLLRDSLKDNWAGVFIPDVSKGNSPLKAAEIPEWWWE